MNERHALGIGVGVVACLCAGAAIGLDSARHIDRFYLTPGAPRYQPLADAMPGSSPADWDQAPVASAPVVGGSPDQAGRAERAFFDAGGRDGDGLGALQLTREERELLGVDRHGRPLPVRVHRVAIRQPEPIEPMVAPDAAPATALEQASAPSSAHPDQAPSPESSPPPPDDPAPVS